MKTEGFIELPPNTTWRQANGLKPGQTFPLGITNVYLGDIRIGQVVAWMIGASKWTEFRHYDRTGYHAYAFGNDDQVMISVIRKMVPQSVQFLITFEAMEKVPAE